MGIDGGGTFCTLFGLADTRPRQRVNQFRAQKAYHRTMRRHRTPPAAANNPRTSDIDTSEYLAQAFSDIELIVAADVIKSAIAEGRKHVDLEALRSVLVKLTAAYEWKRQSMR